MEQTQVKFRISVWAWGVKKRCRKAEKHSFSLGYIDYNDGQFNKDEIAEKARAIVETNMKSFSKVSVSLLRVEIGDHLERWEMFDKRHVFFNVETPLIEQLN